MSKLISSLATGALFILISNCSDSSEIPFEKNDASRIAVIKDQVMMAPEAPARAVFIYLTDRKEDTTRYIIRIKTDSTGGFLFDHLPPVNKRNNYYLYAHYISRGIIFQSEFSPLNNIKDTIIITPRYKPGIKVTVTDSISNTPVSNVPVCLFTSEKLFENPDCSGSLSSKPSNASGIVFFDNMESGKYFIKVNDKIGDIALSGKSLVTFDKSTNKNIGVGIRLQQAGISIVVKDAKSFDPIPGVNLCLFTNQKLAADTTCNSSLKTIVTDNYGRAFFSGLNTGTHYFVVNQVVKNITFKGLTSFDYAGASASIEFYVTSK